MLWVVVMLRCYSRKSISVLKGLWLPRFTLVYSLPPQTDKYKYTVWLSLTVCLSLYADPDIDSPEHLRFL